jgi:hypothetical protein
MDLNIDPALQDARTAVDVDGNRKHASLSPYVLTPLTVPSSGCDRYHTPSPRSSPIFPSSLATVAAAGSEGYFVSSTVSHLNNMSRGLTTSTVVSIGREK